MIKTILTFVYILVFNVAHAQTSTYFPFPDSSAWWTVRFSFFGPPPVTIQYYILGDTVISANQYHKVYTYDTLSNYSNYFTAFRQDTSAKRIFMVNSQMTSEYLAYDFNLAVGDTFILDSIKQFTVTIVDSVLVQGQYRKHIHLSAISTFWCLCTCEPDWIEGIGSLYGLLPERCSELTDISLECFGINNQTVYPDTGTCPLFVATGIDNDSKAFNNIIVLPNPFTDKINITSKRNEHVEISLFDVTARKVFNQSFTNSTSINTEQLAKGIYLYEVRNKNGVIKKGKVVKD